MENEIQILSDAVANRIAAGEVVSRPAAAVKELLENAIDAGADSIRLVFKDGGKSLMMVQDNGKGMSESDARLCFERHATSKIKDPDDIFNIQTKGFRGEALASIAAIAKVELKTRRKEESSGTLVRIEGSEIVSMEACSMNPGTVISIKSLFYNVPARRKFLKNDFTESKHIIEEFERVAIAHPEIKFELVHGEQLVHKLEPGNLRQRLVDLYGKSYNERLVPVSEETDIIKIEGFIVKPEFARKTAGEQFFFANKRFIRSPFLKHAVDSAFEGMIQKDMRPGFFLFLSVDAREIDINIHPQKTEVKFSDERIIYHIIQSSVKKALGKFNIAPSMDFERDVSFDLPFQKPLSELSLPGVGFNPSYNPFDEEKKSQSGKDGGNYGQKEAKQSIEGWESIYKPGSFDSFEGSVEVPFVDGGYEEHRAPSFQWLNSYIITSLKSGLVIIDQHRAHYRILYERYKERIQHQKVSVQQEMFPTVLEYKAGEYEGVQALMPLWVELGFDVELFGGGSIIVRGVPAGGEISDIKGLFDEMLENWKHSKSDKDMMRERIISRIAKRMALRRGVPMSRVEMERLLADLFSTQNPNNSPDGKSIIVTISRDEIGDRMR